MPDFELPVSDHEGNRLVELTRLDEALIIEEVARTPCPLSLVVITSHRGVLFGLNRWRNHWELPGGMVDPSETHRVAAARELTEETGLVVPAEDLELVGSSPSSWYDRLAANWPPCSAGPHRAGANHDRATN